MTSTMIFVDREGVTALSDGGFFNIETWDLMDFGGKQFLKPEWDAVVLCAGCGVVLPMLDLHIPPSVHSFDGLVDAILPVARHVDEINTKLDYKPRAFDLILGGWSEKAGAFRAFRLFNEIKEARRAAEGDPWQLHQIACYARPDARPEILARLGVSDFDAAMAAFGPVEFGLRVMVAQRHSPKAPDGPCVAGFCQATRLTRGSIVSQIIHRWPDKLGQRVRLDPAELEGWAPLPDGAGRETIGGGR